MRTELDEADHAPLQACRTRLSRGGTRAAALAIAGLLAVAAARAADSDAPTSSLSWVRAPGAESCISTRALAEAVERRLRRPAIVSAARAQLSIEGLISPSSGGFVATVVLSDRSGTVLGRRELARDGEACSALDEELALVIALMIDPDAALQPEPATERPAPPEPVPVPAPARRDIAPPAPRPALVRTEPRPVVDVTGHAALGWGLAPGWAFGGSAAVSIEHWLPFPLELWVSVFPSARAEAEQSDGAARFVLASAGIGGCLPGLRADAFRLDPCAGVQAGVLHVQGADFDDDRSATRPMLDAVARLRALWSPAGPWVLRLGAAGVVPLIRDRFEYVVGGEPRRSLFRPAAVGAMFELGAGVHF